jgi:dienelactone hydrolase
MGLRLWLAGIVAAGMSLAVVPQVGAAPASPEDFGPHAVAVSRVQIPMPVDPGGPEGVLPYVTADLYVPDGAGQYPLVQLSHAWPGTLQEFPLSGWGRRLASRGFVVVISDRRAASTLAVTPSLDQPVDIVDLSTEVNSEDILRVLRWAIAQNLNAASVLHSKVDARRVAIAGHSLGGYYATFAAVKAQSEGPQLSALVLLDPSDERLGAYTLTSSLTAAPSLRLPTIVLASEENQHPVMCDMSQGTDCTLVANQEYHALTNVSARLGLRVVGSAHEDVEDPKPSPPPNTPAYTRLFQRYGMAWVEFWAGGDCRVAGYLGGPGALVDRSAGRIALFQGATPAPVCNAVVNGAVAASTSVVALPNTGGSGNDVAPVFLTLVVVLRARRRTLPDQVCDEVADAED